MNVRFKQKVITYFGTFDKDDVILVTPDQAKMIHEALGDAVEITGDNGQHFQMPTFNPQLIPEHDYTKPIMTQIPDYTKNIGGI